MKRKNGGPYKVWGGDGMEGLRRCEEKEWKPLYKVWGGDGMEATRSCGGRF